MIIKGSDFMEKLNNIHLSFRLSEELVKKIDKFADKLELKYLPIKGKGVTSFAIRLLIEDSINRYMGPKNDPDELMCPFADEMSEILPVLKNIRLRGKLEDLTGDNQEEIDKIIKEFA
ncbi:hypothetical protein ES708_27270 [subsurface metagenome]